MCGQAGGRSCSGATSRHSCHEHDSKTKAADPNDGSTGNEFGRASALRFDGAARSVQMEFSVGTLEQDFNFAHTQREARSPSMIRLQCSRNVASTGDKHLGSCRMRSCASRPPVFTCSFGARRNVRRIDQTPKLREMTGPPLVRVRYFGSIDCCQRFRLITPAAPVAVKRIHATSHIDSRIDKCGSSQSVFFIKLERRHHKLQIAPSVCQAQRYITSLYALRADNDTR